MSGFDLRQLSRSLNLSNYGKIEKEMSYVLSLLDKEISDDFEEDDECEDLEDIERADYSPTERKKLFRTLSPLQVDLDQMFCRNKQQKHCIPLHRNIKFNFTMCRKVRVFTYNYILNCH